MAFLPPKSVIKNVVLSGAVRSENIIKIPTLLILYYVSLTAIVIFALSVYLLKLDLWPTPRRPRVSLIFSSFGNAWLTLNLLLALHLSLKDPQDPIFAGFAWKAMAIPLIIAGAALSLWAWRLFKTAERLFGMRMDMLVTWGPYRYIRHPQ